MKRRIHGIRFGKKFVPFVTIQTWSGSRVSADRWPAVLKGWQRHAAKLQRELNKARLTATQATVAAVAFAFTSPVVRKIMKQANRKAKR